MDQVNPEQTVHLADALAALRLVPSETIDLVVADPPYNLGKDYGNNQDDRSREEYCSFSLAWLTECKRVLKSSGTIYVFMGFRFISTLYDILENQLHFSFNSWIVWHYTQGMGRTRGFSARHDDILMFTKSDKFKFNLDAVRIPQKYYRERNNMRGANPGDVWEFSHVHYCNQNRQNHSTQKPEGLIERMVLASSDINDNVLDPFSGSGTTLRVCQQLKRNCTAYEINPEYVEMARERLAQPFEAFDSIDPRMERIPKDLRSSEVRAEYIRNHQAWFLGNHDGSVSGFLRSVKEQYPEAQADTPSQNKLF